MVQWAMSRLVPFQHGTIVVNLHLGFEESFFTIYRFSGPLNMLFFLIFQLHSDKNYRGCVNLWSVPSYCYNADYSRFLVSGMGERYKTNSRIFDHIQAGEDLLRLFLRMAHSLE